MDLYSKGTFGKDALQWTKCVVKYLHDNYADQVLSCKDLSIFSIVLLSTIDLGYLAFYNTKKMY